MIFKASGNPCCPKDDQKKQEKYRSVKCCRECGIHLVPCTKHSFYGVCVLTL